MVSPNITLDRLHDLLQAVMGWQDAHLHRFRSAERTWSDPRFGLDDRSGDERAARIGEILVSPGTRFLYDYDFGDNWVHAIDCEGTVESDAAEDFAVCTGGARACPPEDCGGPPGYDDLLKVLRGRNNQRYKEMREWVGDEFDPERFSTNEVNAKLSRLCTPNPAASKNTS